MSRLSALSWLTSGAVHTLAFALLGTLLAELATEQPEYAVRAGGPAAAFVPPPQVTSTVDFELPVDLQDLPPVTETVPVAVETELLPEMPVTAEPVEPEIPEPPVAPEEALAREELLALNDLAVLPDALLPQPRSLRPRQTQALPVRQKSAAPARKPETSAVPPAPPEIERTAEASPQPELPPVETQPVQRPQASITEPPVTEASEEPAQPQRPQPAGSTPTRPARPVSNPSPVYPPDAISRRLEGTVLLRVTVSPAGFVKAVTVITSSGEPQLDQSALDAVRHWKFAPAMRDGEAVEWTARLPIRFRLD